MVSIRILSRITVYQFTVNVWKNSDLIMVVKLWNRIQSDTLRARETWQRHSGIIKLQDYLLASAQTNTGIMRFSCKIAINVTPIVRLRLVDSHISTCLIRLRFALVMLSRFISCESLRRIVREQKETGKKKKKEWKAKKWREKRKEHVLTFPSILSLRYVPFPWEVWTCSERTSPDIFAMVSILNCVMARLRFACELSQGVSCTFIVFRVVTSFHSLSQHRRFIVEFCNLNISVIVHDVPRLKIKS